MKTNNPIFLKWWLQAVVTIFSSVLLWHLNWFSALYNADQTKISFFILFVFVIATILTGYISKCRNIYILHKYQNYVWFSSEAMITLGMIGTVAGFLMMLGTAFYNVDVSNSENLQAVISEMAVGMSTALSTTLVGLICSVLVKFQMVVIENSWEDEDEVQK